MPIQQPPRDAQLTRGAGHVAAVALQGRVDELAVGVGQLWGGETEVAGVDQDNRQRTTNLRFTATRFFTPKDQLQLQLGRDLAVENGPREDFRLNLRYAHIF